MTGVHEPRKGGHQFPGMAKGDDTAETGAAPGEGNPFKRKKTDPEE